MINFYDPGGARNTNGCKLRGFFGGGAGQEVLVEGCREELLSQGGFWSRRIPNGGISWGAKKCNDVIRI